VSKSNLEILLFMLALVRKIRKGIATALLLSAATIFASCASEKQITLVDDPDSRHESMIPWNKQERWETAGQFANMTDRR
jgi:hypothetical protein